MDQAVRDFVDSYKRKPMPPVTVQEFYKQMGRTASLKELMTEHNHEIERYCDDCDHYWDARKTLSTKCEFCGKEGK